VTELSSPPITLAVLDVVHQQGYVISKGRLVFSDLVSPKKFSLENRLRKYIVHALKMANSARIFFVSALYRPAYKYSMERRKEICDAEKN
jgi:hypothetical protein